MRIPLNHAFRGAVHFNPLPSHASPVAAAARPIAPATPTPAPLHAAPVNPGVNSAPGVAPGAGGMGSIVQSLLQHANGGAATPPPGGIGSMLPGLSQRAPIGGAPGAAAPSAPRVPAPMPGLSGVGDAPPDQTGGGVLQLLRDRLQQSARSSVQDPAESHDDAY